MPRWSRVPTWPDAADDWTVLRDGFAVGRVYVAKLPHSGEVWHWFVLTYPGSQGYCDTLAEALEDVRKFATGQGAYRWPP